MNFYVAGMYPNTAYQMHFETITPQGSLVVKGPDQMFTTGAINANLPSFSFAGTSTDPQQPVVLHSVVTIPVNGSILAAAATDLAGNVLWYSSLPPIRTEPNGNYWGFVNGPDDYTQGIHENDLAGNPVLQTTVGDVNDQLQAMGARKITAFHHEVRRIIRPNGQAPNGYILTLGSTEQVSNSAQGGTPTNPVDIMGDEIIVLDQNLNVVWAWDAFRYLDINQPAILGELCSQGVAGCEPFNPAFASAKDWLHSNSVQYTPYDGNLVLSIRHQDAVIKVNFANLAGDGHIMWKLGNGPIQGIGGTPLPTFTLFANGTQGGHDLGYPWFSHQHDAEVEFNGFQFNGFRVLTLFDNGNTRQANFDPNADSRCQIWAINENTLVGNLNTNVDVGSYSFAIGSAQILANGSLSCDSGFIGGIANATTNPRTQSVEALQNGNVVYELSSGQNAYRTFRMRDLYSPVTP